jgi:hypothetical protein
MPAILDEGFVMEVLLVLLLNREGVPKRELPGSLSPPDSSNPAVV